MSRGRIAAIKALTARGMRGGLDSEESFQLCELVDAMFKDLVATIATGLQDDDKHLNAAIILVEEMKDCGGISDVDIEELHRLLMKVRAGE